MAYTLDNLRTDIRNYTEVGSNVLSDTVLERLIKNAELKNTQSNRYRSKCILRYIKFNY